jgi:glyoxylase-like metal-dependent hydrolase (beta-lactamase superfamily II)
MNPISAFPTWELYALRYANLETTRGHTFLGGANPDGPQQMAYYVWLARQGSKVVLIDTGFNSTIAKKRSRQWLHCPISAWNALGIQAKDISDVVVTHLHYDHAGNLALLPHARLHLQERELKFATSRYMCINHISLGGIFEAEDICEVVRSNFAGRLSLHSGSATVAPGIELILTGGHTPGMQMVRVQTARGQVLLLSDAAHLYENIAEQKPFHIVFDLPEMIAGWRTAIESVPDTTHLIPGHDPKVMEIYPAVHADPSGSLVRLDTPPSSNPLPQSEELLNRLLPLSSSMSVF